MENKNQKRSPSGLQKALLNYQSQLPHIYNETAKSNTKSIICNAHLYPYLFIVAPNNLISTFKNGAFLNFKANIAAISVKTLLLRKTTNVSLRKLVSRISLFFKFFSFSFLKLVSAIFKRTMCFLVISNEIL